MKQFSPLSTAKCNRANLTVQTKRKHHPSPKNKGKQTLERYVENPCIPARACLCVGRLRACVFCFVTGVQQLKTSLSSDDNLKPQDKDNMQANEVHTNYKRNTGKDFARLSICHSKLTEATICSKTDALFFFVFGSALSTQ